MLRFVLKVKQLLELFTNFPDVRVKFGFLAFVAYSIPAMLAMATISASFWERKSIVNQFNFFVFFFFSFTLIMISFVVLLLLKFILARNFNFVIFDFRFVATRSYFWNVYAHIFSLISLFYFFLMITFGGGKKPNCFIFIILITI